MSKKTPFEVTLKAGEFVAGQRNPGVGKQLMLSDEQARYALISGELARPDAKASDVDRPAAPARTKRS